jgi:hypothetical protein
VVIGDAAYGTVVRTVDFEDEGAAAAEHDEVGRPGVPGSQTGTGSGRTAIVRPSDVFAWSRSSAWYTVNSGVLPNVSASCAGRSPYARSRRA